MIATYKSRDPVFLAIVVRDGETAREAAALVTGATAVVCPTERSVDGAYVFLAGDGAILLKVPSGSYVVKDEEQKVTVLTQHEFRDKFTKVDTATLG